MFCSVGTCVRLTRAVRRGRQSQRSCSRRCRSTQDFGKNQELCCAGARYSQIKGESFSWQGNSASWLTGRLQSPLARVVHGVRTKDQTSPFWWYSHSGKWQHCSVLADKSIFLPVKQNDPSPAQWSNTDFIQLGTLSSP